MANLGFDKDAKVIVIKNFFSDAIAGIYQARLESNGIKTYLSNDKANYTSLPAINEGFRLYIKEKDAPLALEIIKEMDANQKNRNHQDFREANQGDIQFEKEQTAYEQKLEEGPSYFMFYFLIFMVIIGIILGIWKYN